jgi:hypothetical protein
MDVVYFLGNKDALAYHRFGQEEVALAHHRLPDVQAVGLNHNARINDQQA